MGGTQCSFSRTQAEQGHVLVVAASHLIFRRRQPSQARITRAFVSGIQRRFMDSLNRTLESLVTIVFIDENIV
jgi:hypothetical protein